MEVIDERRGGLGGRLFPNGLASFPVTPLASGINIRSIHIASKKSINKFFTPLGHIYVNTAFLSRGVEALQPCYKLSMPVNANHPRPISPAASDDGLYTLCLCYTSTVVISLLAGPNRKDKGYRRYASNVERALSLFDTALQEWADYIAFLGRLLKAVYS